MTRALHRPAGEVRASLRPPRIVFITQVIDPADPVLGVSIDLVRALAGRCDRVAVVANEVRQIPDDLDAMIVSLGKEAGARRLRRGIRFQRALGGLVAELRPDAVIAHMCPVYLNFAALVARRASVPLLLWYTHRSRTPGLALAERLADAVLTTVPGSYPRNGRRPRAIGHAIDIERFARAPVRPPNERLELLALGRTSPSKNYPVTIRAVARARDRGADVRCRIIGPATTRSERRHRDDLKRLIGLLGLEGIITLEMAVPRADVPHLIAGCDALVSTTASGSADKVVLEAMAMGRPVLLTNEAFAGLVGDLPLRLLADEGDARELAEAILGLNDVPHGVREQVAAELSARVTACHSLDRWAEEVLRVVRATGDRP